MIRATLFAVFFGASLLLAWLAYVWMPWSQARLLDETTGLPGTRELRFGASNFESLYIEPLTVREESRLLGRLGVAREIGYWLLALQIVAWLFAFQSWPRVAGAALLIVLPLGLLLWASNPGDLPPSVFARVGGPRPHTVVEVIPFVPSTLLVAAAGIGLALLALGTGMVRPRRGWGS